MTKTAIPQKVYLSIAFILFAFFVIYPILVDAERSYLVYVLYTTFIYVALAQAWNLTGGYTGQVSLGSHAFFGIGMYITAIFWRAKLIGYPGPGWYDFQRGLCSSGSDPDRHAPIEQVERGIISPWALSAWEKYCALLR